MAFDTNKTQVESVGASDLALYLKGCDFPTQKTGLLDCAQSNEPPSQVVATFERLPEIQYQTPVDVEREFGRVNNAQAEVQVPVSHWPVTTGSILEIIAGYLNISTGIVMMSGVAFLPPALATAAPLGVGLGIFTLIFGIISVVGGSLALRRKSWGWSLAGSIAALVPSFAIGFGVLALIFNIMGKNEFR